MSMSDSPFILQAMCTSCYEEEVFVDKGPTLALNEAIIKGWLIGRPITIPAPRRVDYCSDCAEIFTKKYVGIYCDRCGVGVIWAVSNPSESTVNHCCDQCYEAGTGDFVPYPCPTVAAIQSALREVEK